VGEDVAVPGGENEAPAQLEGILAQPVLLVPGRLRTLPSDEIVEAEKMKNRGALQAGGAISVTVFIHQQRERDARSFAEQFRVPQIAQPDRRQPRAFRFKIFLLVAQLRHVFAAENSAVVPQKHDDRRPVRPQRTQPNRMIVGIRQRDSRQPRAQRVCHGRSFSFPAPNLSRRAALRPAGGNLNVGVSFSGRDRPHLRAQRMEDERTVRKKIRVVQYGVGPIGASIVKLMRQKEAIEIVGAIDKDPAKAGRDLGEVAGAADAPWGIAISPDAAELLERPVDAVVHTTSSYLTSVMDQLLECLAAGCCVVSTCEELAYPWRKHPELSAKLDAAAKDEGVALVGTGVNPGFVMDKLVLTLSAVAQRVDSVRAIRVVDASKRRLPLQKKIGAGMIPEEFRAQVATGVIKHHGLPESVAMVADGLGFAIDDISETIEPVVARETVKTEFLEVAPGQVAGVHQIARGTSKGAEKIYMELRMYVGAKEPADSVELKGEPNLSMVIPGGTHGDVATAAVVVNAIPQILAAPAGLRTGRDLPLSFFSPRDFR
jgi:2,4-diaminopentanoate dehydrogenase